MTSTEIELPTPPETTNLRELASSTLLVFDLLRPWCKSDYSSLALQSIKVQAMSYMQALEFSVVAAQHGFNIAEDALAFADLMGSCNEVERQEYLRGMLDIARHGENNAKVAHERFRNVRVKLLQLVRDAREQQSHENDQEVVTSPKLNELERGISTLEKFSHCISLYISWWNTMSMGHISQSRRLKLVVINYNSLRAKDVVQKWRNLRKEYVDYTDKIRQIQDGDPQFALEVEHIRIQDGHALDVVPSYANERSASSSHRSQGLGTPDPLVQPVVPTFVLGESSVDKRQIRKRDRLMAFGNRFLSRK